MSSPLAGKRAVVTGAGGFIGSHLTERLVREGAEVTAFVRYNSRNDHGLLEVLPYDVRTNMQVVAGDLRDAEAVAELVEGTHLVFHLGAIVGIPYSYDHCRDVVEANVLGTFNVLTGVRRAGVERLVHTSTSEVYGTAQYVPMDEKHPLCGQSPYAATKTAADKLTESFFRSYDVPAVIVRPFNTYGPRQSARAIIPTIVTQALANERVYVGATEPRRDFTYVSDTVAGMLAVATAEGVVGEVINLGCGRDVSVGELADLILRLLGKNGEVEVVFDASRIRPAKSEVQRLQSDNAKAQRLLGWQPQLSLEEGLQRTIEWIADRLHTYKPNQYNT
ncbi:MAG: SDR family NAD(P)-dependent oxidoreductase [Armatimonadota bacterium]